MQSVREDGGSPKVDRLVDGYLSRYRPYMDMLETKSLLSKVRPISTYDFYVLGRQLEQFEEYRSICEEDGTLSQLGRIPNVALDVLTVAYGSSPIGVLASVQPIDEEQGIVRK